jgi:hypothetical protein
MPLINLGFVRLKNATGHLVNINIHFHGCKLKISENLKTLNLALFTLFLYRKRMLSGV